jgi:hypothetical protein
VEIFRREPEEDLDAATAHFGAGVVHALAMLPRTTGGCSGSARCRIAGMLPKSEKLLVTHFQLTTH